MYIYIILPHKEVRKISFGLCKDKQGEYKSDDFPVPWDIIDNSCYIYMHGILRFCLQMIKVFKCNDVLRNVANLKTFEDLR
jgi:hypothetical protein